MISLSFPFCLMWLFAPPFACCSQISRQACSVRAVDSQFEISGEPKKGPARTFLSPCTCDRWVLALTLSGDLKGKQERATKRHLSSDVECIFRVSLCQYSTTPISFFAPALATCVRLAMAAATRYESLFRYLLLTPSNPLLAPPFLSLLGVARASTFLLNSFV